MNVYVILLIQLIFASVTHIAAKSVVGEVDALTLTLLRNIISVVGFYSILIVRGIGISIDKDCRRPIYVLGFLVVFNQFLYLYGMRYTTAANGALLYALTPIFVLMISRILSSEAISFKKIFGIILAFIGVSMVIFEKGVSTSGEFMFGNLIVLCAVVSYALYTVLGKPVVLKLGALSATASANFIGLMMIFPIGIYSTVTFPFENLQLLDWAGILYLGIGTSIIGYLLWYYALRRIDATRLAVFANGQPIITTILSVIFLDYSITMQFVTGGIITIAGVILTQLRSGTSKQ